MGLGLGSYGLGWLAGVLSTLSPCVLPILPILLGSAVATHAHAPLLLAAGLALSYAVVGTLTAWAGSALGVDSGVFRDAGAVLLGLLGLVLMSDSLQQRFARAAAAVGDTGHNFIARFKPAGLLGQFVIGVALGVVWSPCVGPTLGAAIVLASQGEHLLQVALLMGLFGTGAATPIIALSYLSRAAMLRVRGTLMQVGKTGKVVLGVLMVAIAALILTGVDKSLESWLLSVSPTWLTALTTRF